jgi:hypothetical protein
MRKLPSRPESTPQAAVLFAAHLQAIEEDGLLRVLQPGVGTLKVAWLENAAQLAVRLQPGDTLLVYSATDNSPAVAIGRIGRYTPESAELRLAARESISLGCGESSIDLRADGKVLIRGEDVLIRAKGTKRIRAGTVSIN